MAKLPDIELPLEWDEGNESHVPNHGISKAEVEEVVRNGPSVKEIRKDGQLIKDRYLLEGVTDANRRVTVAIKYPISINRTWGEQEIFMARPITAYDTE